MKPQRILLIGINVALLAAFGLLWRIPESFELADKLKRKPITVSELPPFPEPSKGKLDLELFRTKALSDPDEGTNSDDVSEPAIRLLGIVLTGEQKIAMVEHAGTLRRIEEGVDLGGWQVTSIGARAIRLANAGRQIEIPLDAPTEP